MKINRLQQTASAAAIGLALCGGAAAADFSDTFIGLRYSQNFTEPANPQDVEKTIVQFNHVNSFKYGSNAFNVDTLFSGSNDRAVNSTRGATEIYVAYRNQLQYGKIMGTPLSFGPVRDLAWTTGFETNTKDSLFAPRKRAFVAGPTIKFDVPGTLDLSLLYYKESNHKGIPGTPHPDHTFDQSYMVSLGWGFPFNAGPVPAVFKGFANYIAPKGLDYNDHDTKGETLMRAALMFDVGAVTFHTKNTLFVGIGYEYWKNKFGNPPSLIGTKTSTPTINLEAHF